MDTDWMALAAQYISGDMTLRELAESSGVSASMLYKHSRAEGWASARKKHRQKVVANACARARAGQSRHLASVIRTTDRLAAQLERELEDPDALHLHVGQHMDGGKMDLEEYRLQAVNTRALRDVTRSLRDLTLAIRDLYGIDTRREQVADQQRERALALEERKVAAAERAAAREEIDRDVQITLGPGLEEYLPGESAPADAEEGGEGA